MARRTMLVLLVLLVFAGSAGPASADNGFLTDPSGDYPDIRRLTYNNAATNVVMRMRYGSLEDAQNQSFYMKWSNGYYQVFYSPGIDMLRLRKNGVDKPCDGLTVTEYPDTETTKVVVPRACIPAAPDSLRFRGIATQGTSLIDKTVWSPFIARG